MRPICIPCQRFYVVTKTGFYFIEGMPIDNDAKPGTEDADRWRPYKLWVGDKFECPGCNAEIVSGFGGGPISTHHEPDFHERVRQHGADQLQVNDC